MVFGDSARSRQLTRSVSQPVSSQQCADSTWKKRSLLAGLGLAIATSLSPMPLPTQLPINLETAAAYGQTRPLMPDGSLAERTPVETDFPHSSLTLNRQLAQMLPDTTPIALFLTLEDETWDTLTQFELFNKISAFSGGSLHPSQLPLLPPALGFGYNEYVRPWVGGQAVLAFLPDTSPRSVSVTDISTSFYTMVPVTDRTALQPFLESIAAARAREPEKRTYNGVEMWVWPSRTETRESLPPQGFPPPQGLPSAPPAFPPIPPIPIDPAKAAPTIPSPSSTGRPPIPNTYKVPGLSVGLMGDFLVFAPEPEAIKTLADYQQLAQPSLGESELFLRSRYDQTAGAIARAYVNLSEVVKFNLQGDFPDFPNAPGPISPPQIPGLPSLPGLPPVALPPGARAIAAQTLQGITLDALVYPQTEGLRFQGRLYGNGLLQSRATPELPYADSALGFVPAPTYALSSGRNVAGLWKTIASGLSLAEPTRPYLTQAREAVLNLTGLDLDTELLGWMDREFVLFFFPSREGIINQFLPGSQVEVGIAIQTSDRPTAQKALDAIDNLVGPFIANPVTINDTPAVSWQLPDFANSGTPISYLSHSWIAEDTVIFTSGAGAMAKLLNATAFEPINEHPTFLNATRPLANPNNGYAYFNAGSTLSLVYSVLSNSFGLSPDDPFFQIVKSFLGTIRGGGSTTSSTRSYWQLDSLLNLAPAQNDPFLNPFSRDLSSPSENVSGDALDEVTRTGISPIGFTD